MSIIDKQPNLIMVIDGNIYMANWRVIDQNAYQSQLTYFL